jgi:GMP synthase-like glutamine amidotransferase
MTIHVLQHVAFEEPGDIVRWAQETGRTLRVTRAWEQDLPRLADGDGLVVMGGSMSVHDEGTLPWLGAEKRLIAAALERGVPTLGICLGAQLVAGVLGAGVGPAPRRETGWFPVRFDAEACTTAATRGLPRELSVFHWHGEMFGIPRGARRIASSAACANQGFVIGERAVALQFHLEVTEELLSVFRAHLSEEDTTLPCVQSADEIWRRRSESAAANRVLRGVLDGLFD